MTLYNLLRTAAMGVSANKMRAALTTLGIIIGVASVISMLALGNGARAAVENQFRSLGANQIQVSVKMGLDANGKFKSAGKILSYMDGLLIPENADQIESVDISVNGSAHLRRGRNVVDIGVQGTTANAFTQLVGAKSLQPAGWKDGAPLTANDFLLSGRFYTPEEVRDGSQVCVLGYQTALDLFDGDDPVGQSIEVNRGHCTVVGVLAELESTSAEERYSRNTNQAFYMPVGNVINQMYNEEPSVFITAYARDENRIDEAKDQISRFLRERHQVEQDAEGRYQDDFSLTTRKDILGQQQQAAQTFSILLTAMAAVSLAVGGIGIMNVMLVSVTERMREIGVRIALGARPVYVVLQFLVEAILISAGGGLLGVVAGVLAIPLAASLNNGQALLAPGSIPLAFGVALLTGVIFGLYPAWRASRLNPIECLRYE